MNKGKVYIVSGPSGVGKDTVLSELFKLCPEIEFSISTVTRDMRPDEIEGQKYNFVSRECFEQMISENELLEHNEYVGNYYGTPKAPVIKAQNSGKNIIIEIDVNGARQIKNNMPEAIMIFILPPTFDTLEKRLISRATDSREVIDKRIEMAYKEILAAPDYDYLVINDDLMTAVREFESIIKSNVPKTENKTELINRILNN